jgi:hypothetical protein
MAVMVVTVEISQMKEIFDLKKKIKNNTFLFGVKEFQILLEVLLYYETFNLYH